MLGFVVASCLLALSGAELQVVPSILGVPVRTDAEFANMGCYRNRMPQKLKSLEKTDDRLDKYNYKRRENAIEKCFAVAKDAGYEHFAIGNKGQCWGSKRDEYAAQGKAKQCPKHGKGK